MKALVYELNGKLSVLEREKPAPKQGEALIRVYRAGICGSDIVAWQGGFSRIVNPVVLGHEIAGVVEGVNATGNANVSPGDKVAVEPLISCGVCEPCRQGYYNVCRKLGLYGLDKDGGFTSFICVPVERLHRIPEGMSMDRAAFTEPTAVAVHMIRRSGLLFGQTAAVFGAGPIGILVALVAQKAGASRVVVTDINEHRLKLAKKLGFHTLHAAQENSSARMKDFFGAEGADISFELAASPHSLAAAVEVTKVRGVIVAGGMFKQSPVIDLQQVTMKEQHVLGTRVYTYSDFHEALRLLNDADFPVEELISKRIRVEEAIEQGFQAIKNGEDLMKVLIRFNESL